MTAAADINARIEQDSVVGLIGSNGAGKTTFINMVTGYLTPSSGQHPYQERDITGLSPRAITRLGICRSFQIPQLFNTLSGAREPAGGCGHRCALAPRRPAQEGGTERAAGRSS